jgi:hypothetical protein
MPTVLSEECVNNSVALNQYISSRLCSPQWGAFLPLFAVELTQDLTPGHLSQVMRRTGGQFARRHALGAIDTLVDLQAAVNRIWDGLDWGWVEMREAEDRLVLAHYYAPLQIVFGVEHQAWSGAFLEGAYEWWMRQLDADLQLRASAPGESEASDPMTFYFGK